MNQEATPDGVIAQMQISSAEASDSGAYFCQASNLYGRDQQLVQLLVQGTEYMCGRDKYLVLGERKIVNFFYRLV